jgi:hypothetical protein
MEFKNPWYFAFVAILLLAYVARHFQIGKRPEFVVPRQYWTKYLALPRLVKFFIGLAGLALIGFSLTQPRIPLGFSKNKIKVNDIL